jgi:hypothetical protein
LVKSAATLCCGGFGNGQLKAFSIDYFILMKKRVWHALYVRCRGFKNGVNKMASNGIDVRTVTTILL